MTRNIPYFRLCRLVEFLHPVLAGIRTGSGVGLPEVMIAITVLGTGVLGVVAIGSAARRMAHVAAVRSAQAVSAGGELEGATGGASGPGVTVDTVTVAPGLIELRVTAAGTGPAGDEVWVARTAHPGP